MKETVLLYNVGEEKAKNIKRILLLLGIRAKIVTEDMYEEKLGVLAGVMTKEEAEKATPPVEPEKVEIEEGRNLLTEEMLVMCGLSNQKVDRFLMEMRKKKVERIDLKAVLTPYNALWNSCELHKELEKEHKVMQER